MIVGCLLSITSKDISLTTVWIWTKLGWNDTYVALFNNCSDESGPCIFRSDRLK